MTTQPLLRASRTDSTRSLAQPFGRADERPYRPHDLHGSATDQPDMKTLLSAERKRRDLLDSAFVRKLSTFAKLSPGDLDAVSSLYARRRKFQPGRDMIHQGQTGQRAYILAEGWVSSYKILANGSRQILGIHIPGDFFGLRSVLLRTADHTVEPITEVIASEVAFPFLLETFGKTPRLAAAILWAASRDEAIEVENLVGMGRRSGEERLAHFLLELSARLRLVGLGDNDGYDCPLSQYILADAMGLSAVHVNRCLRELREKNLVTFQNGRVVFQDFGKLLTFADFDQNYLDHDGPLLR